MFTGGPLWMPPPCPATSTPTPSPPPATPNPTSSVVSPTKPTINKPEPTPGPTAANTEFQIDLSSKFHGKALSDQDRDHFEDLVRNLTIERASIREAMGFALEHAESAPEVIRETLSYSLSQN